MKAAGGFGTFMPGGEIFVAAMALWGRFDSFTPCHTTPTRGRDSIFTADTNFSDAGDISCTQPRSLQQPLELGLRAIRSIHRINGDKDCRRVTLLDALFQNSVHIFSVARERVEFRCIDRRLLLLPFD